MSATLRVISGGVLTTVQDHGRQSALRYGVPSGGAMDRFALYATNRLVGNSPDAAGIEITAGGAAFEVLRPTLLALTGADLSATWNNRPLPLWTALFVRRGDQIALPARRVRWGARTYLALSGGVDVPLVLGSRSTHLPGGFGGLQGRALRRGDIIDGDNVVGDLLRNVGCYWSPRAHLPYGPEPTLRFIPGPHQDCFAEDAHTVLTAATLRVSQDSNRMGYRLEGVKLQHIRPCSLPSLGVIPGVIQVPPDGTPILLMADAQTTGGYPIIGVVIAPDLPLAAQLLPGDTLRLMSITQDVALMARRTFVARCTTKLATDEIISQLALTGSPV